MRSSPSTRVRLASRPGRLFLAAVSTAVLTAAFARADALKRLTPEHLEAVHKSIESMRPLRQEIPRVGPYKEYRANLHVHSKWSHDSRGSIEEIVAAAKKVGTSIVMFSEHPAAHYDFFKDGHQGLKDGVLLIPGAESQGFLLYPTLSLAGIQTKGPQELSDLVCGRGGMTFVSHLEERMDWNIRGVTGVEIYNTHADFKDEKGMQAALRNPLWLFQTTELIRKYPQETYSSLQDYPADYLKRWDELCLTAPHTGVSANDAHQNVGLVVRWIAEKKVRIEDALETPVLELDIAVLPNAEALCKDKQIGDILTRILLDPYENALRHVGTHLLMKDFSETAVHEALAAGRAFVAFDWLADATGFDFAATTGADRHAMGSRLKLAPGLKLTAQSPLPVNWRLLRRGEKISQSMGRTLEFAVQESGPYRVEAWLDVAGEPTLWILSNPIYVEE